MIKFEQNQIIPQYTGSFKLISDQTSRWFRFANKLILLGYRVIIKVIIIFHKPDNDFDYLNIKLKKFPKKILPFTKKL